MGCIDNETGRAGQSGIIEVRTEGERDAPFTIKCSQLICSARSGVVLLLLTVYVPLAAFRHSAYVERIYSLVWTLLSQATTLA